VAQRRRVQGLAGVGVLDRSARQVPAAGVGGGARHLGDQQGAVVGGLEDVDEQRRQGAGAWHPAQGEVAVGHAGPADDEFVRVGLVEAGAGDDGAVEERRVVAGQFGPSAVSCGLVFGGQPRRWLFDEAELGGLDDVNGRVR
jgi:hypothetical protein